MFNPSLAQWEKLIANRLAATPARQKPKGLYSYVKRAQLGDAHAFGRLYDNTVEVVYEYLYLGGGTQKMAEMLTAITFMHAKARIMEPTPTTDVFVWLLKIARELLHDQFNDGFALRASYTDETPDDLEVSNIDIFHSIQQLAPLQQEHIVLRYMMRLGDSDIAALVGSSPDTVAPTIVEAFKALFRLMIGD